jgi:hypothetical protein
MEAWGVCVPLFADSHHFDEQDPDPHLSEKSDSVPHYSENMDPDPSFSDVDPQLAFVLIGQDFRLKERLP